MDELNEPEDPTQNKFFSSLILLVVLFLGIMTAHSVFVSDGSLDAAHRQCKEQFVLEPKYEAPTEDLLLSINNPVYEQGYPAVGLCIEKNRVHDLHGRYIIRD